MTTLLSNLPQLADHPWVLAAATQANRAGYPLLLWKATGDDTRLTQAIGQLLNPAYVPEDPSGLTVSNYGLLYLWLCSELRAEMTAEQQADFERRMDGWAAKAHSAEGDSDEIIGMYFFYRLALKVLGKQYIPPAGSMTVQEMRDRVRLMYETAGKDGSWATERHEPETQTRSFFPGTAYRLHDDQLGLMGALIDGLEHYPEIVQYAHQEATQLQWEITSNRQGKVEWGDMQGPDQGEPRDHSTIPVLALLYAVTSDDNLLDLLAELAADERPGSLGEMTYLLPWFDPTWLPKQPVNHNPQGLRTAHATGLSVWRKGDWLFQHHAPETPHLWIPTANYSGADSWKDDPRFAPFVKIENGKQLVAYYLHHTGPYTADYRLWDGEEWIVGHPLGYQPPGDWHNAAIFGGVAVSHLRGLTSITKTHTGFIAESYADGRFIRGPGVGHPKQFLDIYGRRLEYIHPGIIDVTDRFWYLKRPEEGDGWSKTEWAKMEPQLDWALSQSVVHCQTEPRWKPGGGLEWESFNGRLVTMRPDEGHLFHAELRPGKTPQWGGWFADTWRIRLLDNTLPPAGEPVTIHYRLYAGVPVPETPVPPTDPIPPGLTLEQVNDRLQRIEQLFNPTILEAAK